MSWIKWKVSWYTSNLSPNTSFGQARSLQQLSVTKMQTKSPNRGLNSSFYLCHTSNEHWIISGHAGRARTQGMPKHKTCPKGNVIGGQFLAFTQHLIATCVLFTPSRMIGGPLVGSGLGG